jgi:hypothetical protein
MTIGAPVFGAVKTANNANVANLALPAGLAVGDILFVIAYCRGTAATLTVTGYTPETTPAFTNLRIFTKTAGAGETTPTVTVSGGAAGDDVIAVCGKMTGAKPAVLASANSSNISAQNIAAAAVDGARYLSAFLVIGGKQDDWTSVATLAGFTESIDTFTTTGSDAGLVIDYLIATGTTTGVGAQTFVVTGGAAATSRALSVAFDAIPALSVLEQDVYPPRVLITVTGLTPGDDVAIYRQIAGVRTLVRTGSTDTATDVAFLAVDAELPFGVPVSYVAIVQNWEVTSAAVTYVLPGSKVALSDAVSGLSAEVVIMAWPDKTFEPPATKFKLRGRNAVVVGPLGQFEGSATFYVETAASSDAIHDLLAAATQGVIQIRTPDVQLYPGYDCYVAVTRAVERKFSQDGSDQRRLWDLDMVEVNAWSADLGAATFTYADLEAAYTGQTYVDLAGDYATYLALAQADLS